VRAWHATYGLPAVITNCTNNYGPRQFPEKLIPVVIGRALAGDSVPVYGDGQNVRDWLYVDDHCDGIATVFEAGPVGETFCLGGEAEVSNLELVRMVLDRLDEVVGRPVGSSRELITFVADRPGHDFRYSMDISKAKETLAWRPRHDLADGLAETVEWYVANQDWVRAVTDSDDHRAFSGAWYEGRR
jgi:dTDP-glucose 4,6-dehydratase